MMNTTKQSYDITDIQIAVCEQVMSATTEDLVDLYNRWTGAKLKVLDEDAVGGDIIEIDDGEGFREWLSFLNGVLPERLGRFGDQE